VVGPGCLVWCEVKRKGQKEYSFLFWRQDKCMVWSESRRGVVGFDHRDWGTGTVHVTHFVAYIHT
jgi:hypothetical protein